MPSRSFPWFARVRRPRPGVVATSSMVLVLGLAVTLLAWWLVAGGRAWRDSAAALAVAAAFYGAFATVTAVLAAGYQIRLAVTPPQLDVNTALTEITVPTSGAEEPILRAVSQGVPLRIRNGGPGIALVSRVVVVASVWTRREDGAGESSMQDDGFEVTVGPSAMIFGKWDLEWEPVAPGRWQIVESFAVGPDEEVELPALNFRTVNIAKAAATLEARDPRFKVGVAVHADRASFQKTIELPLRARSISGA